MNPEVIQKRDRRLRRQLLDALYRSRTSPRGGLSARPLVDLVESVMAPNGFDAADVDGHALALLIDLRDGGYVVLDDTRTRKMQRWGVDTIFARITDKGSRLCREELPVDPSIEDERIG